MSSPYDSNETEFWFNVSAQSEMPLAGEISDAFEAKKLAAFFQLTKDTDDAPSLIAITKAALLTDGELFTDLRKFLGLSDKRAYLDLSYLASRLPHPGGQIDLSLAGCNAWDLQKRPLQYFVDKLKGQDEAITDAMGQLLAEYLCHEGLLEASRVFRHLDAVQLEALYKVLIQPRENQQKAAKRRGHGCEALLAKTLIALNVPLLPLNKAQNPMGSHDPNIDRETLDVVPKSRGKTFSFDMLVMHGSHVHIAIQSLIHTSDPGQYGVNKSDETVQIANLLKMKRATLSPVRKPVELWGLVDGVGFCENKADTINKMLDCFDTFIQLKTLYKAGLRLHQLGRCKIAAIQFSDEYSDTVIAQIAGKYVAKDIRVLKSTDSAPTELRAIEAGRATLYVPNET